MKSKVLIVDDHPIFCMGMRELLNQEDDFVVCALAANLKEARQALAEKLPDMAIIDITLGDDNGLELVKEIRKSNQQIYLLVLSMHGESIWAERAIKAGANGYLMKKEASESVIYALRNIRRGEVHISNSMVSRMLNKMRAPDSCQGAGNVDLLTDRELEVFRRIGAGFSTKEIAQQMKVGVKTVSTYRDRIKQKLGLKNAAELIRRAVLWTDNDCF